MYDYWDRIKIEENCDMAPAITTDYFEIKMKGCPSLSNNLDNDAGLCHLYCDHCAGWINPVIRRADFDPVHDIISRTEPRCYFRVCKDRQTVQQFAASAEPLWDPYDDLA